MAVNLLFVLLAGLLWALGGVLLIGLALLLVPIRVSVSARELSLVPRESGNTEGGWLMAGCPAGHWRWEIRWLLGLFRFTATKSNGTAPVMQLHLAAIAKDLGKGGPKPRGSNPRRGPQARPRRPRPRQGWSWLDLRDLRALWPDLRRLIPQLWRSAAISAQGELEYGFEDPAVTGWCEAVRAHLSLPGHIVLRPDFTGPRLAGHIEARMTIWPIRAARAVIRFLLQPRVRRWWWQRMRQQRRPVQDSAAAARA